MHNSNNNNNTILLYYIIFYCNYRCCYVAHFRDISDFLYTQTSSSLFSIHCFFLIKIYYVFNANQHILLLRGCVYTAGSFVRDQPTVSRLDTYAHHRPPRARARTTSVKEKDACNYQFGMCVCVCGSGVLFLVDFGKRKYNIVFGEKDIIIWSPYV